MNSRQLIYRILTDFDDHPANLERIIDSALSNAYIDHRDRRFVFEVVYGIIRKQLTIDYIINFYLTEEKYQSNDVLRRILKIGMYQILYMDRVPNHAAVNEAVNLAKTIPQVCRMTSIVNACLRKLISNKQPAPLPDPKKNLTERLSVEYSHPVWFIERWLKYYGFSKTKKILSFNNEKPSIFLRRRIRDISRQQFDADVKTICDPATGYLNLYYKLKNSLLPENIRMIHDGLCNVQAPSSGWVVALLNVQKGDHLIDLCSAPGGKTALVSELCGDNGTVCACDVKWQRLLNVVETTERMGLANVYPLVCDGLAPPFTGLFDKVLLDAPCTGTGVLNRHPEARWIRTADDVERLIAIQRKLLHAAARLIGKNGVIVYSTCSIEPEENELQIELFLKEHPEFVLDKIPDCIPANLIDDAGYLRITPFEHQMDGMFGARLRRL